MADNFHDGALIFEFFQLILFDDLAFDLFDSDHGVLPASSVDDTVATLGQLAVIAKVTKGNLVVLNEVARFI